MKQRLTAKEEEVMNILWKNGDMFIRDIVAAMPEPRPNYNTVATQVKFLEEKMGLDELKSLIAEIEGKNKNKRK